jgi:osmotically-inducible protein OsmY
MVRDPACRADIGTKETAMRNPTSLPLLLATGTLFLLSHAAFGAETDNRIESSAKASYVFKTYLKDDAVHTESKDGVVTLTGTVSDPSHRRMAEDTVEGLPGVKRVENRITVTGEEVAEHSDAWLGTKVKAALLFHRNVSATSTDVFVKDGVVSLRGEAQNEAQKELTAEYAWDIEGVKEVKNEMTLAAKPVEVKVKLSERIDDASITAQVKASLMLHRSTSALKTKVQTTEGVVTVSGVAKNPAEKSLVTKLISDIHGVHGVVNQMTVAEPVASN